MPNGAASEDAGSSNLDLLGLYLLRKCEATPIQLPFFITTSQACINKLGKL
jgi:hypothetical protein